MTRWREFAVIASLALFSWTSAHGQETEQIPPPALKDPLSMEIPSSAPHMANYGFVTPPGWNIGVAGDALGVYDSNPAAQLQASSDVTQRYSGNVSLTYLSKRTAFQADYMPSASYYRRFTSLNSVEQNFSQSLWRDVSQRTSFAWQVNASKHPSWGGSTFASSSFGSLLMQLAGLTGLDLRSNVSTASTGFTLRHRLSQRSHINANFGGGVSKYVHTGSNQFMSLLTAPDSSTWSGQMSLSYDYQLSARRSLGAGIASSYFLFTAENYHTVTQSASLRYSQVLGNGWAYMVAVGPEVRLVQHSAGNIQPGLSFTLDAGRKTRRSAYRINVVRAYQIGQAQGNLTSWTGLLSAEHSIGRRYFAGTFVNYQRSVSEVSTGQLGTGITQSLSPAVEGGVRLGRHIVWLINYGFSVQNGALTQEQNIYRQQFVSGLSFHFDSLLPR